VFRTFGANALAAYLIHDAVDSAIKPFTPKDSPLWYVLVMFALFMAINYVFMRYLEKRSLYLRL
jgi:peptidoglycan/LPS O-acetylase OafA/YrhL